MQFMKRMMILVAAVTIAGCDRSAPSTVDKSTHDFGTIYLDDGPVRLTYTFDVVNNTPSTIQIVSINKTCGCVKADVAASTLASDTSTTLDTGIDLASPGPMQQAVSIILSDGSRKQYVLKAFGKFKQELHAIPSRPRLDPVTRTAKFELYLIDSNGRVETDPPEIEHPDTVALVSNGWETLEQPSRGDGRPTRQLASLTLDFARYGERFPVDVRLRTKGGAQCLVTVVMGSQP